MKPRVVIVGAGFGGQGASQALLSIGAKDAAEITVIDQADELCPAATWQYYLTGRANPVSIPLEDSLAGALSGPNLRLNTTVASLHPEEDRLFLSDGTSVSYDYLILAPGARADPDAIPGLAECALDVTDRGKMPLIKEQLDHVREGSTVLIMVTKMPYKCPPYPFELAFLLDHLLRQRKIRETCRIVITMPVDWPFGGDAAREVFRDTLERKNIEYLGCTTPTQLSRAPGDRVTVSYADAPAIEADVCLAVYPHSAPTFIPETMLNAKKSVPVDMQTNRVTKGVAGKSNVFCVGDACVLECPAKPGATLPKVGEFAWQCGVSVGEIIGTKVLYPDEEEPLPYTRKAHCVAEAGDGDSIIVNPDFSAPTLDPQNGLPTFSIIPMPGGASGKVDWINNYICLIRMGDVSVKFEPQEDSALQQQGHEHDFSTPRERPQVDVTDAVRTDDWVHVQVDASSDECEQEPYPMPEVIRTSRRTQVWQRTHGIEYGQFCEASPMQHRPPDLIKTVNKRSALRRTPEYPGDKLAHCDVGTELHVLEHREFMYQTRSCTVPINCYRVQMDAGEGWMLDYSPGEDLTLLMIRYDEF